MGYFTILAAILGFSEFLYPHASLGCYYPKFRNRKNRLSHNYVDNYYPLASGGTFGCCWSKSKKDSRIFG